MALRDFIREGFRPPAIVFTETKERCQRLMGELLYGKSLKNAKKTARL